MKEVIDSFDIFLTKKGLKLEATIIGGAALIVMDVISRITKDVDFLEPKIPKEIKKASIQFAKEHPGFNLDPGEWINNGPYSLKRDLPVGWQKNLQKIYSGKALTLFTLGRLDLLRTKLYACADREVDYDDCLLLRPTVFELEKCKDWVLKGDTNPLWPKRVEDIFKRLIKDLGHD